MPLRTNQKAQKQTTNEIGSSSCVDRISDLPKNVIEYILEKLEIWDVVRTSVLSKKWRQNWTSLPQLTLSDQFTHRYKECFESVVSGVLFQHIGPIPKFFLTLHSDMPNHWNMINPRLCFLSANGVKDLTLNNKYDPYGGDDVDLLILPSSFYSCSELRVFWLGACLFKTPFAFNGFKSLTSFTCEFVTFEGLCLGSVISLCPLIQELTLDNCNGLERVLSIDAPNLRVFVINDFCDVEYITFKNTHNLSSLSILLQFEKTPAKERKRSYISEFFSCLRNLETLSLRGEYIVQELVSGVVPKRLPSLLNFLKDLKFGRLDFCNSDLISCLLCIIRSSPNLQLLDIRACSSMDKYSSSSKDDKAQFLSYLEQQLDYLDFSLDHLHTIEIKDICGAPPEMLIIKFLLAVSPYLKNMMLARGVVPKRLPNLLNFLKDLKLEEFDFCNSDAISCLLCIIRSSPNLQLLNISAESSKKYKAQIISYLKQQLDFLDCSLDHLHTIKVMNICGSPPEMLTIKFLLAISPCLKNMVIKIQHFVAEKALRISTELLKFRRKSPDAEVTFI